MAAPKGVGAVEAYEKTKVRVGPRKVGVKEFMPDASSIEDAAARLAFQTAKDIREVGFSVERSSEIPGLSTKPAGGPSGGRRKTRRGGALTKPLPELLEDLVRNPSKATLENVLSDLKASRILRLEAHAERLDGILRQPLRAGEDIETRVRAITRELIGLLRVYLHGGRRKTRRGGALTKPIPELVRDLERDPSKSTLENVLSDLKASDNRPLEAYGRGLDENLREPLQAGESMDERVQTIIRRVVGMLRMYGRGRRRKTTRRRK